MTGRPVREGTVGSRPRGRGGSRISTLPPGVLKGKYKLTSEGKTSEKRRAKTDRWSMGPWMDGLSERGGLDLLWALLPPKQMLEGC